MSTLHEGRVSTKFKYAKVIGIPAFSLEHLDRDSVYSNDDLESIASVSSSASSRAVQELRKVGRDEGCLITKQVGFHLIRAHWIQPVRKNPVLKLELETYLEELGLVGPNFLLDSPPNVSPMDRNLEYTLNHLGLLAVTCSKATLLSLISLVEKENLVWQQRGGKYTRYFDFKQPPFTNAMYELVLLHPRPFLQKNGSALPVFTEDGDKLSGKLYFLSPDGALREGPNNDKPRLPAFSSNRSRAAENMLNPFLVILNAEIAFRRFKRLRQPHPLCDEYTELVNLTIDLVDKIYFEPVVNNYIRKRDQTRLAYSRPEPKVEGKTAEEKTQGTVEGLPMGIPKAESDQENVTKPRPKELAKNSRLGRVIHPPGPHASHDEIVEYNQYLMSGCDYYDEDEDDEEDQEDYWDDGENFNATTS